MILQEKFRANSPTSVYLAAPIFIQPYSASLYFLILPVCM